MNARLVSLLALVLAPTAAAQVTTRVSLTAAGGQANDACGTGAGQAVAISSDGTRVVFVAAASNLVPGDTNGFADIYVRDLAAGTTLRASLSTGGAQGDALCRQPCISSNGRYVAFESFSTTFVAGDTNGWSDVFVRDLLTGITTRESVGSGGTQGNLNSEQATLSGDGGLLVFWSNASNLVPGDSNGTGDVFLRDRATGTLQLLTRSATGLQANGNSLDPYVSADGGTVAFASVASNLVGGDTNGLYDVFVLTLPSGPPRRVPIGGPQPNGASELPTLSANGRYVAFESDASNLVPGDTNGQRDVFVQDLVTLAVERVSVATGGAQANGGSTEAWISEDGRFVAFESGATNLVPGDTNGTQDVFVHDRVTGETRRLSVSSAGAQGNGFSFHVAPSADGSAIAFASTAGNLVAGDTNFTSDVFLRSTPPAPMAYCFGGGAACPCGNGGAPGRGCASSNGAGALLGYGGTTSAGADDLRLDGRFLIPNQPALAFVGTTQVNGGAGVPFGDGLRCAGGGVVRLGVKVPNALGDASWGPGLGATGGWSAGDTRHFQLWYRDPSGSPCGNGFNLTNGLSVTFGS